MNSEINTWIENHIDELKNDIKTLCSIPSVNAPAEGAMPFGKKACRALNETMKLAEKYGFTTKNYDNFVGTLDYDERLPHTLDILGHVDVVPAGEGWTVTEPFKIIEKDGRLYGRGTSDDKGPLLCAIYALRAIKETGTTLSKGIRIIVGSDEETGSLDIAHYFEKEKPAKMTFSPDSEFPLINIEKGQFRGTLSKDYKESKETPRLISLDAGIAVNAVPQKAVMKFEGLDLTAVSDAISEIEDKCGVKIIFTNNQKSVVDRDIAGSQENTFDNDISTDNKLIDNQKSQDIQEITVIGESAHASTPEKGKNAGLAALELLTKLPLQNTELQNDIKNILKLFPYSVTDGSGIGIKMSDEESHDLTCTLDIFHIDENHMEFTFDARTPVSADKENCEEKARKTAESLGFKFTTPGMIPPHVVPSDSEFVRTLLASYEDVTGLKGDCLSIGGGTYVHDIENGVAFGAILPGVDTHMHGADEFIDISNLITATKVYAEAILRLCG